MKKQERSTRESPPCKIIPAMNSFYLSAPILGHLATRRILKYEGHLTIFWLGVSRVDFGLFDVKD